MYQYSTMAVKPSSIVVKTGASESGVRKTEVPDSGLQKNDDLKTIKKTISTKQTVYNAHNGMISTKYIPYKNTSDKYIKLFEQKPCSDDVICNNNRFIFNFNALTQKRLTFIRWKTNKIIVAGECVLACLLPIPAEIDTIKKVCDYMDEKHKNIDITLFLHSFTKDDNPVEFIKQLINDILKLMPYEYAIIRSKHSLTIKSSIACHKNIRIITSIFNNPEHVLQSFILPCEAICYDGSSIQIHERAIRPLVHKMLEYDISRSCDMYDMQIMKYVKWGFSILCPTLSVQNLKLCEIGNYCGTLRLLLHNYVPDKIDSFTKSIRKLECKPEINTLHEMKEYNFLDIHLFDNIKELIAKIYLADMSINEEKKSNDHQHYHFYGTTDEVLAGTCPCKSPNSEVKGPLVCNTVDNKQLIDTIYESDYGTKITQSLNLQEFYNCIRQINKDNIDIKIVNQTGFCGRTLLHVAVSYCKIKLIIYLVEKGADILHKNSDGFNSIHLAIITGCVKTFGTVKNIYDEKKLLYNINDTQNIYNLSALHLAIMFCEKNDTEMVSMLLKFIGIQICPKMYTNLVHLALSCEKYPVARLLITKFELRYNQKRSLCEHSIHNVNIDKLSEYIAVFKINKLDKTEDELCDQESDVSISSESEDKSASESESSDVTYSSEASSDVSEDISDDEIKVPEEPELEIKDEKQLINNTTKINSDQYSFDIEEVLTNYIYYLCGLPFTEELMNRIHAIESLGGTYLHPLYKIESAEEHKNIKQPIFKITKVLVNMECYDDAKVTQCQNGFKLFSHALRTGIDVNWINHNGNTLYDIIDSKLEQNRKDINQTKMRLNKIEDIKNVWKTDNLLKPIAQVYINNLDRNVETLNLILKFLNRRNKLYNGMLTKLKEVKGVAYHDNLLKDWYDTKYIKTFEHNDIETKSVKLPTCTEPADLSISCISNMVIDEECELFYKNIFKCILQGDTKELDTIIDNKTQLDVLFDKHSFMDCAVLTKNVDMILMLIEICNKQSVEILYWMLSYSRYDNMLSLLIHNDLFEIVEKILMMDDQYWKQLSPYADQIYKSVMNSQVKYIPVVVRILTTLVPDTYQGLQSVLSPSNDSHLHETHIEMSNIHPDVSEKLPITYSHNIEYEEGSTVSDISIGSENNNIYEITAKYCTNVDIITFMFTKFDNKDNNTCLSKINNFLTLFVSSQNDNENTVNCLKEAIKYNGEELKESYLLHYSIYEIKPKFVEVLKEVYGTNYTKIDRGFSCEAVSFFTDNKEMEQLVPYNLNSIINIGGCPTLFQIGAYFGKFTNIPEIDITKPDSLGFNIVHYVAMSSQNILLQKIVEKHDTICCFENIFGMTPLDMVNNNYMKTVSDILSDNSVNQKTDIILNIIKSRDLLNVVNKKNTQIQIFDETRIADALTNLMITYNASGQPTQYVQYMPSGLEN